METRSVSPPAAGFPPGAGALAPVSTLPGGGCGPPSVTVVPAPFGSECIGNPAYCGMAGHRREQGRRSGRRRSVSRNQRHPFPAIVLAPKPGRPLDEGRSYPLATCPCRCGASTGCELGGTGPRRRAHTCGGGVGSYCPGPGLVQRPNGSPVSDRRASTPRKGGAIGRRARIAAGAVRGNPSQAIPSVRGRRPRTSMYSER